MLKLMDGDMFDINADILVNCVNCVGVMGAGVALECKKRYPDMFSEYRKRCIAKKITPGNLWVYITEVPPIIVNFPTKQHFKTPSKYQYIENGLAQLRNLLYRESMDMSADKQLIVALPALGCGYGGLDWGRVLEKTVQALGELKDNIVVCLFRPH